MHPENPAISLALARLVGEGIDAGGVALGAASVWRAIDGSLAPIIGQVGVAALYKRSLYLTRGEHPCLVAAYDAALTPGEYVALQATLSQQTNEDAVAAIRALLHTFHDILSHLIGESLTERLLRSAWDSHSSGQAVKDISA